MGFIFDIANILAGILLGITALDKLDGESNFFNNVAKKLMPFTLIIGGISFGLGLFLLIFSKGGFLYELVAVSGGLLLLTHVVSQIPAVGGVLVKISKKLMPFKVIIGITLLIFALIYLF
ncbi:hypothetical protein [Kordia jejudonensis]|uniref:hypothetical protein n=1 Tax=Kordia jejudonensis TaxID=1348245 RepID=UPI0006295E45|nr:hypothetical protein [Kordia jejudonensis]